MRNNCTEEVRRCIREYAQRTRKALSDEERDNWMTVFSALTEFSPCDRELLLEIYRGADTFPDNVYRVSMHYRMKQNYLWKLRDELERKVAQRKELA